MGLFGKEGVDTIDYTYLQKKGLIKKKEEPKLPYKVNSQGLIDLTPDNGVVKPVQQSGSENTSPLSFLDSLAQSSPSVYTQPPGSENNQNIIDDKDIGAVKNKIDDLEFKLERLIEKLTLIESKMENFEKKVFN